MTEDPGFHTTGPLPGGGLRPPRPQNRQARAEDAGSYTPVPAHGAGLGRRPIRAAAVIVVAIVVALVAWLVLRETSSPSSTSPVPKGSKPLPISVKGLQTLASLGIVIYWVGERPGFAYELTKTADNRVFIRYLPGGVRIGSDRPYLTIGTYPVKNAFTVTSRLAGKSDSVKIDIHKGVAFYNQATPRNVYLAYPGSDYQIEVYDPSAAEAQRIVASGEASAVR